MNYSTLSDWIQKPSYTTTKVRDQILTARSLNSGVFEDLFPLYILCTLNRLHARAKALLEAYINASPEDFQTQLGTLRLSLTIREITDLIWRTIPASRPTNIILRNAATDEETQRSPPEFDLKDPAFFQLANWTSTGWMSQEPVNLEIDDQYDPHQWRRTEDPWTHAICARLLCRVPKGEVADRAAVSEAFEAIDGLYMKPPRPTIVPGEVHMPVWGMFPIKVYFLLALGLGKREKAAKIFRLACTPEIWQPQDLLATPALYEVFCKSDTVVNRPRLQLVDDADAKSAVTTLTAALMERKQTGRQDPLHGVPWPELLRRLSEAAFDCYGEEYAEMDDPPQHASDILLPPITPEKLAMVEQKLGPLPPDLREMVQIANGFKGGRYFAGGGFPGVDKLDLAPSGDYGEWLGVERAPEIVTRTVTNEDGTTSISTTTIYGIPASPGEDMDAGPIWVAEGAVENDNFEHVICPPGTWQTLARDVRSVDDVDETIGIPVEDGEYRVMQYAYWEGGGQEQFRSMRHWIASETAELERQQDKEAEAEEESGPADDSESIY